MHISVLAVFSYAGCRQACVTGRMRRGSRACHARRAWRRSAAALPLAHSAPLRGRGTHRAGIACGVRMSGLDWMKLDEFSSGISPMSGWMNSPLLGEIIHPSESPSAGTSTCIPCERAPLRLQRLDVLAPPVHQLAPGVDALKPVGVGVVHFVRRRVSETKPDQVALFAGLSGHCGEA